MVLKLSSALIIFLSVFAVTPSFSQKINVKVGWKKVHNNAKSDTIYYDVRRKLTWNDFQGKPIPNHFAGAVTSSGFGYNSNMSTDGNRADLEIEVYVYFDKRRSWKKEKTNSDYHLTHEQHHFDITMLGAQEFYDKLKNANFTISNYSRLVNEIFDDVYSRNKALQEKYDGETKNSIHIEKQMEWNAQIEKWVLALRN